MTIRRLIVPLAALAVITSVSQAGAQGAFPAPLPAGTAQGNASPFPPVNGAPAAARPSPFPPVNGAPASQSSPFPPVNQAAPAQSSPFPPVGGGQANSSAFTSGAPPVSAGGFSAPRPQQQAGGEKCMQEFQPLRKEAERRGELIKIGILGEYLGKILSELKRRPSYFVAEHSVKKPADSATAPVSGEP